MRHNLTATTIELCHTFFESNFTKLSQVAKNKCNANKLWDKGPELMSELVTYIYNSLDKIEGIAQRNELEPFCVSWISNQVDWHGSTFKDAIRIPDTQQADLILSYDSEDEDLNEKILEDEMNAKNNQARIRLIFDALTWEEQKLFRLYFTEFKSYQKLANEIGSSKASVGLKVKALKDKIRENGIYD
jgi:RNA polymerase sigma factor (sigma-70 family)